MIAIFLLGLTLVKWVIFYIPFTQGNTIDSCIIDINNKSIILSG